MELNKGTVDWAKKVGVVVAVLTFLITVFTGGFNITVWALDQVYVRNEALAKEFDYRALQGQRLGLIKEIKVLDLKSNLGKATDLDKAIKYMHELDLKELNTQLQKFK